MRFLALDVGDERIGVAISDETGLLARPLTVVRRVAGKASFIEIKDIVKRHQVEKMVVGLPLLPSGDEGDQVRSTRAYVHGMREHVDLDVIYVDERDTTLRAEEIMTLEGTFTVVEDGPEGRQVHLIAVGEQAF